MGNLFEAKWRCTRVLYTVVHSHRTLFKCVSHLSELACVLHVYIRVRPRVYQYETVRSH